MEQLSRLPHSPSVPFQTTPSTIEVPEEVCPDLLVMDTASSTCSSVGLTVFSEWIQVEEDMERRPKPRIWSGEHYDSDHDEDVKISPSYSNTR